MKMRPMLGLALRDWYSRQLGLGWVPNNEKIKITLKFLRLSMAVYSIAYVTM